jgi:hypothetical protein
VTTEPDNSRAHQVETDHVSGEEELEHLGYEQQLKRTLSLVGNVALVVAGITPATALLIYRSRRAHAGWDGCFLGVPARGRDSSMHGAVFC